MTERSGASRLHRPFLVFAEAVLVYGAILGSVYVRVGFEDAYVELVTNNGCWKAAVATFFCLVAFYFFDLYDFLVMHDRRELVVRLLQALGLAWIVLAFSFLKFPALMLGRGVSVVALPISLALMVAWRMSIHWFLDHFGERILILRVGNPAIGRIFRKKARVERPPGFLLLRFVQFFYSRKAVEEVFKPMLADWRFEYYECLKENRVSQARWTSFRWMIRFIFAMGVTEAIAFLRGFVPFGRAKN